VTTAIIKCHYSEYYYAKRSKIAGQNC